MMIMKKIVAVVVELLVQVILQGRCLQLDELEVDEDVLSIVDMLIDVDEVLVDAELLVQVDELMFEGELYDARILDDNSVDEQQLVVINEVDEDDDGEVMVVVIVVIEVEDEVVM